MFPIAELSETSWGGQTTVSRTMDHMPEMVDIPSEFKTRGSRAHPYVELVEQWFFSGIQLIRTVPKEGVDRAKAMKHLRLIIGSWDTSHEHKIAATAFLIFDWFQVFEAKARMHGKGGS